MLSLKPVFILESFRIYRKNAETAQASSRTPRTISPNERRLLDNQHPRHSGAARCHSLGDGLHQGFMVLSPTCPSSAPGSNPGLHTALSLRGFLNVYKIFNRKRTLDSTWGSPRSHRRLTTSEGTVLSIHTCQGLVGNLTPGSSRSHVIRCPSF